MLILSRQCDETIEIQTTDGVIEVTVTDIRGDKVRLGFNAPRSVRINREEVAASIRRKALQLKGRNP